MLILKIEYHVRPATASSLCNRETEANMRKRTATDLG